MSDDSDWVRFERERCGLVAYVSPSFYQGLLAHPAFCMIDHIVLDIPAMAAMSTWPEYAMFQHMVNEPILDRLFGTGIYGAHRHGKTLKMMALIDAEEPARLPNGPDYLQHDPTKSHKRQLKQRRGGPRYCRKGFHG